MHHGLVERDELQLAASRGRHRGGCARLADLQNELLLLSHELLLLGLERVDLVARGRHVRRLRYVEERQAGGGGNRHQQTGDASDLAAPRAAAHGRPDAGTRARPRSRTAQQDADAGCRTCPDDCHD